MKKIKINNMMRTLLEEYQISLNGKVKLSTKLKAILTKGIVQVDDCFFFKEVNGFYSDELIDKTGNECYHNKLWINFISDKCRSGLPKYLKQGIELSTQLYDGLIQFNTNFNIILSYNGDCVDIRFHKIRPNEKWLTDDIELYKSEGILLIEITVD